MIIFQGRGPIPDLHDLIIPYISGWEPYNLHGIQDLSYTRKPIFSSNFSEYIRFCSGPILYAKTYTLRHSSIFFPSILDSDQDLSYTLKPIYSSIYIFPSIFGSDQDLSYTQ